jgi:hypothetical protein
VSVYGDILDAVKAKVDGLGLQHLPAASVVLRKAAVYLAEHDAIPLLVVAPVMDEMQELQFDGNGFFRYEVRLTVYHESGLDWRVTDWLLGVRESLRNALFQPTLAGASTVFDCDWNPGPVYDAGVLPVGVDVSRMSFVFTSSEAR